MGEARAAAAPVQPSRVCRICGAPTRSLLAVNRVPPQQNRFFATEAEAIAAVATSAEFLWCNACLHIRVEKERAIAFDHRYDNQQSHSPSAKAHLALVAQRIAQSVSLDARIVEIGCGRGEFLGELQAAGFTNVVGFDPAAPAATQTIRNEYWPGDSQKGNIDCLVLRHALEEIPNFAAFLATAAGALSEPATVYIEITNAARIFETGNIWSLYPEYANLFSIHSLGRALFKSGMVVDRVDEYAGGEWLGVWARRLSHWPGYPVSRGQLRALAEKVARLPRPIVLWGAAGRGGNFLAFLEIDPSVVSHVVDSNESKWGLHMPPYGQKVISPEALKALKPATVLLASAKFREEVLPCLPDGCLLIALDELKQHLAD